MYSDLCLSDEEIKELHSKYPERRHEFWRSFASNNIGYDFYVSRHCWILPLGVNAETLLSKFGGCKSELFPLEEAQYLSESISTSSLSQQASKSPGSTLMVTKLPLIYIVRQPATFSCSIVS